ncbi:MAG: glucose-6-phosphate isomerase, partial [Abditibacteriaceae bacterium]
MTNVSLEHFQKYFYDNADLGVSVDISRLNFSDNFWEEMEPRFQDAFREMADLERGAIANTDENRMVGHYWLRAPELAPGKWGDVIRETVTEIKSFAQQIHQGKIAPEHGGKFENLLVIGIGGSALGPEFVAHALSDPNTDKLTTYFFDNTDPGGYDRTLAEIGDRLPQTLVVVISKSGGTKETRNGMLEAQNAFHEAGLHFGHHAVAITEDGSALDKVADSERWLARFPMWDWVGGRTSELSAVGLLPAALQGFDIDAMLDGAAKMDAATRLPQTCQNPAAWLAGAWFHATRGAGKKDMVVLPYKDQLLLFSRYLQQLVMESLGKEKDRDGNIVHQGISVYGNKGATDQHADVQQLRDGVENFFVTFIEVLRKRENGEADSLRVEPHVTSGDFLNGFLYGTRDALYQSNRESITIALRQVDASFVGKLIALFERTVGLYASLINVNAYHQPGVEAGKKAASSIIELQLKVLSLMQENRQSTFTAEEIADKIESADVEMIFHLLRHLEANGRLEKVDGAGL